MLNHENLEEIKEISFSLRKKKYNVYHVIYMRTPGHLYNLWFANTSRPVTSPEPFNHEFCMFRCKAAS